LIFVPYGNDNDAVWRTPWVTVSIIFLNIVIYMATCTTLDRDYNRIEISKKAINTYLLDHPELIDSQRLDELYTAKVLNEYQVAQIKSEISGYDQRPADLNRYSDEYSIYVAMLKDFTTLWNNQFIFKWGYVPAYPSFISMFTSMFLHENFEHLFGNMLILFAIGFSLEDLWGRWVFGGLYLVSGIAATITHHLVFSSISIAANMPTLGASGAIAGVMGAYLIRLYRSRLKTVGFWILHVIGLPLFRFRAVIYLPLWFLAEYRDAFQIDGVAHWAHIGGFGFGMVFALGLKLSGLEEKFIKPRIEAKIDYGKTDRAVTEALNSLEKGDTDRAGKLLDAYVIKNPTDANALLAIVQVNQTRNDVEGTRKAYARLIRQYLRMNENDLAVSTYDSLLSTYTEANPAMPITMREWMAICDHLDKSGMHEIAAVEYRRAGRAMSSDPYAAKALITSGEIFLEKVGNNKEAAHSFVEAKNLKPSQSEWVERIVAGVNKIKELETARIKGTRKAEDGSVNLPATSVTPETRFPPGT